MSEPTNVCSRVCRAVGFENGDSICMMDLVLGLLEAVSFLMITANGSNVSITWTPPFTLDISGVNPDITGYCITVTSRITSLTLNSQCGTNVTEFHYTLSPDSACNTYNFTVVPVNIVGNGTSATVMYSQDEEGKLNRVAYAMSLINYEFKVCNSRTV